jgi:hypothetical protein
LADENGFSSVDIIALEEVGDFGCCHICLHAILDIFIAKSIDMQARCIAFFPSLRGLENRRLVRVDNIARRQVNDLEGYLQDAMFEGIEPIGFCI